MRQRSISQAPALARTSSSSGDRQPAIAPPSVSAVLSTPGTPLPAGLQARASRQLGFDVGAMRMHHDVDAGRSAHALAARAYAVRPHVVFAPGMYQPDTARGQSLILHELGHCKQQRELDRSAPLHVGASPGHERNADALAARATDAALPLPGNHLACDAESDPPLDLAPVAAPPAPLRADPGLAELAAPFVKPPVVSPAAFVPGAASQPRPALPVVPEPLRAGVLFGGASYRVLADGNVEVTFAPRSASSGGQRIIDDADDPANAPHVDLPATGERAVQHERKRLVAIDARVVAVYQAKDIAYDGRNAPVGIRNYKPIAVNADTTRRGVLIQTDENTTHLGRKPVPDEAFKPEVTREYRRVREIRGDLAFTKAPGSDGALEFDKLEKSRAAGDIRDVIDTSVVDGRTGQTTRSKTTQRTEGVTEATKGKATNGIYLVSSNTVGKLKQDVVKDEVQVLPSGRVLVTQQRDGKRGEYVKNEKRLTNLGIEFQALAQVDARDKDGQETGKKTGTTTVLTREVAFKLKTDQGTVIAYRQVPVARTRVLASHSYASGASAAEVRESRGNDENLQSVATKEEGGKAGGKLQKLPTVIASSNLVGDVAPGLYGLTHNASASLGVNRGYKRGEGPDVAAAAASPRAGQTDLIRKQIPLLGDKHSGNSLAGNVGLTSTTLTAGLAATGKLGDYSATSTPESEIETSTLFGVFSVDTVYSATHLAGAHIEANLESKLQLGGRGAQLKAAQASLGGSATVQVGRGDEQGVEFVVRPMLDKIPNATLRAAVALIEPVLDLKFKRHYLIGAEAKLDANLSRGGDIGKAKGFGASGFVGVRGGLDIDGSIQVGRPIGARTGKGDADGARLGSIKGGVAVILGASAAWRSTASVVGGRVIVGGEGSFAAPLGGTGNIRAELDLWKLGTIGLALGNRAYTAAAAAYRSDEVALARVRAGEHTGLDLAARVALVRDLVFGHTTEPEQAAIVAVLEDAAARFDLFQLIGKVGAYRLGLALGGPYYQRYRALRGE